jgi:hypothetical protein
MARIIYRVGQFWRGLSAQVTPDDLLVVAQRLPPAAIKLFMQMPTDAQRHSLNVLASVQAAGYDAVGYDNGDLAVAALLHDCGKVAAAQGGVPLRLWLRGPLVLLAALLPQVAARWAAPTPGDTWLQGVRYALYVQAAHPAIGAKWAAEAGCSELSCWLIAHHQTPLAIVDGTVEGSDMARALLIALQAADEDN